MHFSNREKTMRKFPLFIILILIPATALAHHGGLSLAFGPGTPIETSSPITLPRHGFVVSARSEYVDYKKFSFADPVNKDASIFNNLGLSYGLTNYLTASVFIPYTIKRQDMIGTNRGFGDLTLNFQFGFNHTPGKGFCLSKAEDTAVSTREVRKTFFSLLGSITLPTSEYKKQFAGEVDHSMQTGFGEPSFMMGFAAARPVTGRLTLAADTSYQMFLEKDGFRFGREFRANLAPVRELYGNSKGFLSRLDGMVELNLLYLTRDLESGVGLPATGGTILYISPGVRFAFPRLKNANLGFMVKIPAWKHLNEESEQQGAEGRETYRAIGTLSFYF
jgi:hypothetical protein